MATVDELKAKLAKIEAELIPLRGPAQAAEIKTKQAQQALFAYYNTPGHISLNAKINAQNALAKDPTNVQLQQNVATINAQWASQQAELLPLLKARDDAFAEEVKARGPIVDLEYQAGQIEVAIARIDPTQASPEAVAYLRETSGVPITPMSDPGLAYYQQSSAPTGPSAIENSAPASIGRDDILDDGSPASGDNTIQNPAPATINAKTGPNPEYELVFNPANIDPNSDPFEEARYQAGLRFDEATGRTEQDIIESYGGMRGLQGSVITARSQKTLQDAENAKTQGDWRVRLSLAPGAKYLYAADDPGILAPLQKTLGVIFPYTPNIQVTYAAHYDPQELTHSNYKVYQYKNSGVDQLVITGDFTAQDNEEANYMLAVIHFFRSVTKMFYGKDQNPSPGTPPPLCYLSGMGGFQFDSHPLVISSFNYNLPNEVDYIRAASPTLFAGVSSTGYDDGTRNADTTASQVRLNELNPGATASPTAWNTQATNTQPTYVPTKMQITITAYPIVTRNDISNNFSLKKYATGELLRGSIRPNGGGIW